MDIWETKRADTARINLESANLYEVGEFMNNESAGGT